MKKTLRMKYVGWFTGLSIMASLVLAYSVIAYEKEINAISVKMAENIAKSGKKRIAVVDFTDLQGNVTELGRFIAEEFSVALLSTGQGFEVVDRTHLQSLLKEHKLSATGLIDPQTAQKLGQIAGVDALITGTITPFGESVRLSVKILDAGTAKLIGANTGDIPKTQAITELLNKGISAGETLQGSPKTSTPPNSQWIIESKGFTFKLQGCRQSGSNVQCNLLVTSNEQDRQLGMVASGKCGNGPSRTFDDLGYEYVAREIQIGSYKGGDCRYVTTTLVMGVPTKANVYFEDVSKEAKNLPLLEVGCYSDDDFIVQFRNIPFTK